MKLSKLALLALVACGTQLGSATAEDMTFGNIAQVGCFDNDCCEPACGVEECCEPACGVEECCDMDCCDSSCCDDCGGCDSAGCCGAFGGIFDDIDMGGWLQLGYYSAGRNGFNFNDHPDRIRLSQAWLYAEKAADGSNGFDLGGRVDYVYGTDAQDTQAFGQPTGWDTGWDNGIYGSAMPQLYAEAAYGDLSVKVGHFYTIIGYEVVTAPDNFFFSHAFTMYNNEPFTHSGALATYQITDGLTGYGGWTAGWDSGFRNNGSNYLGGFSYDLNDTTTVTLTNVWGRFNRNITSLAGNPGDERGCMYSLVITKELSDSLQAVTQVDYSDTDIANGETVRSQTSWNNYLFYTINDNLAVGGRYEWWAPQTAPGTRPNVHHLTFGVNIKPADNVIIRPEIRQIWDVADNGVRVGVNENNAASNATFGIDAILTF